MPTAPVIFDRLLLRARRRRAERLGFEGFLLERLAQDLKERLAVVLRRFALAADLGTPTDHLRRALADGGAVGHVVAMDARAPRDAELSVAADE
ncbi:MAG: SAM-dependent methyltransferase, partial [Pseudorhodoplanes sp.]